MQQIFRPNKNIKIIRSTSQSKKVPDHDTKVKLIEQKLNRVFGDAHKDLKFYISGSYILNTLFYMDKESNDIDIYPRDDESKQKLIDFVIAKSEENIFETEIAITSTVNGERIQVVKNVYEDPEALFANFDIDICCFAYENDSFYLSKSACESIANTELNLNQTVLEEELNNESLIIKRVMTLFDRINKYAKRYNVKLAYQSFDVLRHMSERIPVSIFKPDTGVIYEVVDSSGQIITKHVTECLWSKMYDLLLQNNNIHYDYFESYLKDNYDIVLKNGE